MSNIQVAIDLLHKLEEVKAQRDELLKALEEIEWSNNEQWRTDRARIAIARAKEE